MGRNDRKKASDVFREANYVFAKKAPFREAFPEIESVVVRYRGDGRGVTRFRGDDGWRVLRAEDIGEFVNCSNSLCYNGGFSVGRILRSMVYAKETERTDTAGCQGYEGSPKGRRRYRSCFNHFDVEVKITYREQPVEHDNVDG